MTRRFISAVAASHDRGLEFGSVHRHEVARTVAAYDELFVRAGAQRGLSAEAAREIVSGIGTAALTTVDGWAPKLADEIRGIAAGAGLALESVAAINARTEVLATLNAGTRGECSTVVAVGGHDRDPVAVQNWDWFGSLADGWLVWEIPHPDGGVTTTLTEYGIVGKIGFGRYGLGLLFNILHHVRDGVPVRPGGAVDTIGVPVHVAARQLLDSAATVADALTLLEATPFSASTTMTLVTGRDGVGPDARPAAVCAELWPGGVEVIEPRDGLLLHTNHFLSEHAAGGDLEPEQGPDTLTRMAALRRQFPAADRGPAAGGVAIADAAAAGTVDVETVISALCDHGEGPCSLCAHPDPGAPSDEQYATLATIRLDFAGRTLDVHPGNPCTTADGADAGAADSFTTRDAYALAATTNEEQR